MPEKNRIFTRNFILVTLAAVGSFASFQFSMTVIPLYVLSMGGNKWDIGIVAGMFALASTTTRPFAGRWVDKMGRKPVMYAGAGILLFSTFLYYIALNIPFLIAVRLIHGIGFGAVHTATTVLITDITPKHRWGEAQGYFTALTVLSLAVSPPLGFILYEGAGFTWVFIAVTMLAAAILLLCFPVPETGKKMANFPPTTSKHPFLAKEALLPSAILVLTTWGHGVLVAFLPVFTTERHILNPGLYFTMMAGMAVISRGFVGRLSDIYGRGLVIVPGLLVAMSGLVTLHFTANTPMLMAAGLLYGLGFSTVSPVIYALIAEEVRPEKRGTALGMAAASNDMGIMFGSLMGGFVVFQTGFNFIFLLAAFLLLVAIFLFFIATKHNLKRMFHLSGVRE